MNESQVNKKLLAFIHSWTMLAGILLLAIVIVTSINASAFGLDKIARLYGSNVPALPGYEDFVRLSISCVALMFFPYCRLHYGHVKIDLLEKYFPRKMNLFLNLLWSVMMFATVAFLVYWMNLGLWESMDDNAISRVLGWSEWYFYIPGLISLILWGAISLLQLIHHYKELTAQEALV